MLFVKTYKFKLVPSKEQERQLFSFLGGTRFVYNLCLEYKKSVYESNGTSVSKNQLQKELKEIKNETPWLKSIHSQVLQETTDRLFTSYDNFFRRIKKGETPGFPRFARKDRWSSFKFKQGVKIHPNTNKVYLPKIGKVKFRKSQDVNGDIKNASIKYEADGWYISICCEVNIDSFKPNNKAIGLDLGIKDLVITSEKEVFCNPKTLYKWSKKLAMKQKKLSRKVKGSNNRNKVKSELRAIHQKISRIRKDNLHKITTDIISNNQVIICEDLNARGMMRNHKLAKSIADASWSTLTSMLEYKSKWRGRSFLKVSAHYTSQDCSCCGWRNSELTLKDRSWTCPECKSEHDRDINAAVNILNKGLNELKEAGHVFSTLKYKSEKMELSSRIGEGAEEPHEINKQTA